MADVMIQDTSLQSIGNAIREKKGSIMSLSIDMMCDYIATIESIPGTTAFLYVTTEDLNASEGWTLDITHNLNQAPGFAAVIVTDPYYAENSALGWIGMARCNEIILGDYTVQHEHTDVSDSSANYISATSSMVTIKAPSGIILPKDTRLLVFISNTYKVDKPAESISLNKTELELLEGTSETLIADIVPRNATSKIAWESHNSNVITVENGIVTAVYEGKATVRAAANNFWSGCAVTVIPPFDRTIPELTMTLSTSTSTDDAGSTLYRITMTCQNDALANPEKYYEITEFGILYSSSALFVTGKDMTVSNGATKRTCSKLYENGTYKYTVSFKTASSTKCAFRAYLIYKGAAKTTSRVYSNQIIASYNSLTS